MLPLSQNSALLTLIQFLRRICWLGLRMVKGWHKHNERTLRQSARRVI